MSGARGRAGAPGLDAAGSAALCFVFFVSGAAALIFETLWFSLAGLTFGNSVWAGALVLTSFMGGLALGNGLAARHGARFSRPLVVYAGVEVAIASGGLAIVLALPHLTEWLVPLFRPWLDRPWVINPLRLTVGFFVMLVPTTAMGFTLPLLVRVLFRHDPCFGRVLGRLYGWNTLGAVVGALAGELYLIEWLGVRGTAWFAASTNLVAAAAAAALAARVGAGKRAAPAELAPTVISTRARQLLLGSFLAGGILLALEVVWFRFLQLFVVGTSLSFAIMLAVVLAGIGLGGIVASLVLRPKAGSSHVLPAVAFLSGIIAAGSYALLSPPSGLIQGRLESLGEMVGLCARLMLPSSLLSGILFTIFGEALERELGQETRSTGLLTLANTLGAMAGAALSGFVLLPLAGIGRSFWLLSAAYAAVALAALEPRAWRSRAAWPSLALALAHLVVLASFPFGAMHAHLDRASLWYRERFHSQTIAEREGLTGTVQILRRDFLGRPVDYRVLTNAFSMSGTALDSRRYMKFFVYWPLAMNPDARRALLIGYGAGSTARALADTRLESIDLVDISPEILELSSVLYPDPAADPLRDPRVRTRIEDARYFLQTTDRAYDLITGEPPPPVVGNAVTLYTGEHFRLVRERLSEGGIATYWLPVNQMTAETARSILAAFCGAFEDCSLWAGCKLDLVMIGTRGTRGPGSEERFTAPWRDPRIGPELRALGFELPEQLGATFIADAQGVAELVQGAPPLTDDRPRRLSLELPSDRDRQVYASWTEPALTRKRFAESSWIRALWPPALARRTLPYFELQPIANMQVYAQDPRATVLIDHLLSDPGLHTAILWLAGSSVDHVRISREQPQAQEAMRHLAAQALAERDFAAAAGFYARDTGRPAWAEALRILALCKAGEPQAAAAAAERLGGALNYRCW